MQKENPTKTLPYLVWQWVMDMVLPHCDTNVRKRKGPRRVTSSHWGSEIMEYAGMEFLTFDAGEGMKEVRQK